MKIIEENIDNININEKLSIALGNFDGIHRGHKRLIEEAVRISKDMNIKSAVFTFDINPLKILKPDANVKIIINNASKIKIIENMGVDYLFLVKFNENLANLDEKKFVETLKTNFMCEAIICGYNYTYGKYGHGNVNNLKRHAKEMGYKLSVIDKVTYDGQDISSSIIRHKIENGNLHDANLLLGYNYFIDGTVVKCKQLGRKLGFPTANIEILDNLCLKNGVYITLTYIDGKKYPSVSSIGKNPTVGDLKRMFETHIFDFYGDLYGKNISVELLEFTRGEVKFSSVEELRERVHRDMAEARVYFSNKNYFLNKD